MTKDEMEQIYLEQARLDLERAVDEGLEDPGLLDNEIEAAGDNSQPADVVAPSKAQKSC